MSSRSPGPETGRRDDGAMATQPSEFGLRPLSLEEDPLLDLVGAEVLIEQLRAQAEPEYDTVADRGRVREGRVDMEEAAEV